MRTCYYLSVACLHVKRAILSRIAPRKREQLHREVSEGDGLLVDVGDLDAGKKSGRLQLATEKHENIHR